MTKVGLVFGPKQIEQLTKFIGSAATFGGAAGLGVLYMTDWKLVGRYIPFYGGKFADKEE